MSSDPGPGVPEALPRTLQELGRRLGPSEIDRLWIFPPLIEGRKEWGLVAAGCFAEQGRRRLITARYAAEQTGAGLRVDRGLSEEGIAPPDRLPHVMEGVVRRSEVDLGEPKVVEIGGDSGRFEALMEEFDPILLETTEEP
ncbi:MAG: hypothetical protein BMS9Abin29_2010 [Gemmatimonadota bacterium]|nr:MAG: hypothetical protein BMS9Abin29_2010 [Gemmatimonadota bacterium]